MDCRVTGGSSVGGYRFPTGYMAPTGSVDLFRGSYCYGQVRDYAGSKLGVWTAQGTLSVTRRQHVGEIHPLIAITLGFQAWSKREWPKPRLQGLHERLLAKLATLATPDREIPTVNEWLAELGPHADISQIATAQAQWIDVASGVLQSFSIQHALLFVIYKELQGQPPQGLLRRLGNSFAAETRNCQTWVRRPLNPTRINDGLPQEATVQSFLASLSEDNESDGEGSTMPAQRQQRVVQIPSPSDVEVVSPHPVPSARSSQSKRNPGPHDNLNDASADADELELIELIRVHRPHLLRAYLQRSSGQPAAQTASAARTRPASSDINTAPAKRNKKAFYPTADQERVHQVVTSEAHRGKSPEAYMEYLTTSSLPLDFHPGMLSRLYDFGFGSKGLSVGHFGRVGYLERLRNAANSKADMTDFTLPVPSLPVLTTWAQLHSATRGFLQYCSEMCEPTTIRVAASLDNFTLQLEGWNHWLPDEIPTLVLWINATMERYRNAAAQDGLSGGNSRLDAIG